MLGSLRRALADGGPPALVAAGLREAALATYASQMLSGVVAAVLAVLAVRPPQVPRGWALALLVLSALAYAGVVALAGRARDLPAGVRAAVLLGTGAAVPGLFGLVLVTLEGAGGDAWMLGVASAGLLVSTLGRVSSLGGRVSRAPEGGG